MVAAADRRMRGGMTEQIRANVADSIASFFGNGGSAADAQHLAAEFLGR